VKAPVVIGLAWGDEGKGTMVDFLVRDREADTVVRFNGGPQAGHNVVTADGLHHEFRQFGAGTLAGAATHISRYCVVHPEMLFEEADALYAKTGRWPWHALTIELDAAVVTPFAVAANRIRELARDGRHGSTGLGIWETEVARRAGIGITMRDLRDLTDAQLHGKLWRLRNAKRASVDAAIARLPGRDYHPEVRPFADDALIYDLVRTYKTLVDLVPLYEGFPPTARHVVFEGAQGVLLDERVGFHPYTTGSTTTAANAVELARREGYDPYVIGVTRTYATRHGAGPFPTESASVDFPEPHNATGPWQERFRRGYLDLAALRYAIAAEPRVAAIALTHVDKGYGGGRRLITDRGESVDRQRVELRRASSRPGTPFADLADQVMTL
jgi:adenylosuccinate synthase